MKLVMLISLLSLASCGAFSRGVAELSGHSSHCIDGVEYYQFASGSTVAFNPNGTVRACK